MRLNHVALTVSDRESSARFYTKWFGLTERLHEDDHLLILSNESGALLALSQGAPEPAKQRTGHFGFQIDDIDEVRTFRKRFAEAGVVEAEWQESGPTRVQVFDPDGYRVEVFAFEW